MNPGEKFSIPRLGLEGTVLEDGTIEAPDLETYFKIKPSEEGKPDIFGPGFIPPHVVESLAGLCVRVSEIRLSEGELNTVGLHPEDIMHALALEGKKLEAAWWNGFRYAFKAYHGQPSLADERARIFISATSGHLVEHESDQPEKTE